MESIKQVMLITLLFSSALLQGCFGEESVFTAGECITQVDGAQIWKYVRTEKEQLVGQLYDGETYLSQTEFLSLNRIYSKVPCPK